MVDYRVNIRELGGSFSEVASGLIDRHYTASGLALGTTYEFTVDARNSEGYGVSSEIYTILHAI